MDSDVILLSSGKGVPPSITRHGNDQGASGSNQLYAVKSDNPGEVARILRADEFTGINGEALYVIARPGTMSSHGGQIADILKNSGQPNVRIEPVTTYTFRVGSVAEECRNQVASILHDRMTQVALWDEKLIQKIFDAQEAPSEDYIDISQGSGVMQAYNEAHEIGLSESDINHLCQYFTRVGRTPTNVELMMFAQANSEHCRHKIFNAKLTVDETDQMNTLFAQIKKTHRDNPNGVVNAYKDNTSVGAAKQIQVFQRGPDGKYGWYPHKSIHPTLKAETHNHPTGIAAFPGAATGAGGEIRDEAAPGQGGESRMGFTGFTVSRLNSIGPTRNASPTQIMIDGPLGGVAFNNEFGRPGLGGYFRTYRWIDASGKEWGYQKPIMLAGGTGEVNTEHTQKKILPPGTLLIQIGGPGMSIGVGGGAASSMVGGQNSADADFKSVQRGSPEMQRRGQEVINATRAMGENTPVLSIHDVGAGVFRMHFQNSLISDLVEQYSTTLVSQSLRIWILPLHGPMNPK
ncbi:hypothetical protein KBC86_05215, partial [Candidatus Gracilibacteria bacterium]|nr:hypothetical protein [Candidatus Gracilibacteria bacterium]